jgi:nucleotide-binding universal stress UspA family protein
MVTVAEQGPDPTAAAMADYLKLAGLGVERSELAPDSRPVGEVLLSEAAGEGALLVMGAYGRWRWREWVFGGVTRHVLHHTPVPVLMAH